MRDLELVASQVKITSNLMSQTIVIHAYVCSTIKEIIHYLYTGGQVQP